MPEPRRKCRLADTQHRNVDLRKYADLIIATINETVPGKNPRVYEDYFSTDPLTQSESIQIGKALAKIPQLLGFGKTVTTFRLFDGKNYESEAATMPIKKHKEK